MLGVLAFVLFGIITFRLWYLQVLTGPQNAARATANVERAIPLPAPRGEILDSGGTRDREHARRRGGGDHRRRPAAELRGHRRRVAGACASAPRARARDAPQRHPAGSSRRADARRTSRPRSPTTSAAARSSTCRSTRACSRACRSSRSTCATTRTGGSAAIMLGQIGPISGGATGRSARPPTRGSSPAPTSARPASRRSTTASCRARPASRSSRSTRRASRPGRRRRSRRRPRREPADLDQLPARARGLHRRRRGDALRARQPPSGKAAAFFAMNPDTGRVLAVGSVPTLRPEPVRHAAEHGAYNAVLTAARSTTSPPTACSRPARRSSRSPRSPASRPGRSRRDAPGRRLVPADQTVLVLQLGPERLRRRNLVTALAGVGRHLLLQDRRRAELRDLQRRRDPEGGARARPRRAPGIDLPGGG